MDVPNSNVRSVTNTGTMSVSFSKEMQISNNVLTIGFFIN